MVELVQGTPKTGAEAEYRHLGHFALLHEDSDFGEFIHGAETAGEKDVNLGRHRQHNLAGEEVAKLESVGEVRIGMLLVREGDVETDTLAAVFVSAVVGGFHNTGTAASDSSMAVLGELLAQFTSLEAVFMVLGEPG